MIRTPARIRSLCAGLSLVLASCGEAEEPAPVDEEPTTSTTSPSTTPTEPTDTDIPTPSVEIVDPPPEPVAADVEWLVEGGVTGVASLDLVTQLASTDGELVAVDPFGAQQPWGAAPGELQAAVPWGGTVLMAASGGLFDWDGVAARPSVLQEAVGEVERLVAHEGELWMASVDHGLVRWRDGVLTAVDVDDAPVGPFAVGGDVRTHAVVWAGQDDVLHALGNAGSTWVDLEAVQLLGEVDSVVVEARGVVWAAAGGWLHRRDPVEGWMRLDLGRPVWEVHGHPQADGVWLEAEDTWFFTDGDVWQEVTGLPEPRSYRRPTVDAAGRLLLVSDDPAGALRASTTRPLVITGVEEGEVVARPVSVTLLPTAANEVDALRLSLEDAAGTSVPLTASGDGTFVVDPDGLAAGPWTLRGEADYGARTSVARLGVFLGAAFEPTWTEHVEPLYRAECALCHGGAADTVLEEPEDWEPLIGEILYNVEVGNMPLGGDPLSDAQIVIIEAWRDAGFPL